MKNQKNRIKKLAKKKKQRKDFERRRNINRQPPSEVKEFEKDILKPAHDQMGKLKKDPDGNVLMQKVGTKIIKKRVKKVKKDKAGNILPVIKLPQSKKRRLSKAEIKKSNEAQKNVIKTATNN